MRLTTNIKQQGSEIKRLMIYDSEDGVYLFEYATEEDSSALCDYLFEKVGDAIDSCYEDYGVEKSDWKLIPDPLENCQHDWIQPVRVKGQNLGQSKRGMFEKLEDGEWVDFNNY